MDDSGLVECVCSVATWVPCVLIVGWVAGFWWPGELTPDRELVYMSEALSGSCLCSRGLALRFESSFRPVIGN